MSLRTQLDKIILFYTIINFLFNFFILPYNQPFDSNRSRNTVSFVEFNKSKISSNIIFKQNPILKINRANNIQIRLE